VPWSSAPDCLVHHRTVSDAPPDSVWCARADQPKLATLGFLQALSAIIHRTVRCATVLSGVPPDCPVHQRSNDYFAQRLTAKVLMRGTVRGRVRAQSQRRTGQWTIHVRCHMRTKPPTVDQLLTLTVEWRGGAPDCPVRPSPTAFPSGYKVVGGYKYHPNRPFQRVGA
jgi:hypothetical protein